MDRLKKFFSKKKSSFKLEGQSTSSGASTGSPVDPSSLKLAVAEAAERRQAQQVEKNKVKLPVRTYLPPPEKEEEVQKDTENEDKDMENEDKHMYSFNCPELEINQYFPLDQLRNQISITIKTNFGEDPVICGALLIKNCNPRNQASTCIETLKAVLNNLQTDDEEKFLKFSKLRKLKIEKKILAVIGGLEFLNGVGFKLTDDDEWYVFEGARQGLEERLAYYLDVLETSHFFQILLDREAIIYDLNELNTQNVDFDEKVYNLTKDELSKEQQARKEKLERESTLMTEAMRKRFMTKKPKSDFTRVKYKRIDEKVIEATFRTRETLEDLINWLAENYSMEDIKNFDLACGTEIIPVENWSKTFMDLDFYPRVTLSQRMKCQ